MALKRSHLSPRTRAYTKAGSLTVEVVVGADPDYQGTSLPPSEHEYGWKPIWLKLMSGAKRPLWISLTSMTTEELESFKRILDIGIEEALKVSADLDRQALDMLLSGDNELPLRALSSPPPWYEREVDSSYEGPY